MSFRSPNKNGIPSTSPGVADDRPARCVRPYRLLLLAQFAFGSKMRLRTSGTPSSESEEHPVDEGLS
jgi:hypothetical protein